MCQCGCNCRKIELPSSQTQQNWCIELAMDFPRERRLLAATSASPYTIECYHLFQTITKQADKKHVWKKRNVRNEKKCKVNRNWSNGNGIFTQFPQNVIVLCTYNMHIRIYLYIV